MMGNKIHKLYSPVSVTLCQNNESVESIYNYAAEYEDILRNGIKSFSTEEYPTNNLMQYFEHDSKRMEKSIKEKIVSAYPDIEALGNVIYGVIHFEVTDELTDEEMKAFEENMEEQYRDGWGAEFELHEIPMNDSSGLLLHFYPIDGFSLFHSENDYFKESKEEVQVHKVDPYIKAPDFCRRMLQIPGINDKMLIAWVKHAFNMAVIDEEYGTPREEARKNMLNEYAEAFEYIYSRYDETAAEIFNYSTGYVAHELYEAAAYIADGGDPVSAIEMAAEGMFEDSVNPNEEPESITEQTMHQ